MGPNSENSSWKTLNYLLKFISSNYNSAEETFVHMLKSRSGDVVHRTPKCSLSGYIRKIVFVRNTNRFQVDCVTNDEIYFCSDQMIK